MFALRSRVSSCVVSHFCISIRERLPSEGFEVRTRQLALDHTSPQLTVEQPMMLGIALHRQRATHPAEYCISAASKRLEYTQTARLEQGLHFLLR